MRIGAGRFRNALLPDAGPGVRPVPGRLRQSLFTRLLPRLDGARVLDLCAGVGGFGLEALSRGAARVVLVEDDPATAAALRRWVTDRGVADEVLVVRGDARRGGWPAGPYDVVFLDPPFAVWGAEQVAAGGPSPGTPSAPAVRAFLERAAEAAAPGGVILVKLPARADLPPGATWRLVDRRAQGDVALAWLEPVPAP